MLATTAPPVRPAFPFASHFADVLNGRMHYIDEPGEGPLTFLFLHGNPTSSYMWRHIIPAVRPFGRAVAPDLIGMGLSDKPLIRYTYQEHAAYLDAFVERLALTGVILVMQDWGGGLGFDYACRHPHNVKGLVFMECLTGPRLWADFTLSERMFFRIVRSPIGKWLVVNRNFWIEKFLPMSTVRKLTDDEMDAYRAPFLDKTTRMPVLQWPREMPLDGPSDPNFGRMAAYAKWLRETPLPKLFFYAEPGTVVTRSIEQEIRANMKNLTARFLGAGKHYLPEDYPHEIGAATAEWVRATF